MSPEKKSTAENSMHSLPFGLLTASATGALH